MNYASGVVRSFRSSRRSSSAGVRSSTCLTLIGAKSWAMRTARVPGRVRRPRGAWPAGRGFGPLTCAASSGARRTGSSAGGPCCRAAGGGRAARAPVPRGRGGAGKRAAGPLLPKLPNQIGSDFPLLRARFVDDARRLCLALLPRAPWQRRAVGRSAHDRGQMGRFVGTLSARGHCRDPAQWPPG